MIELTWKEDEEEYEFEVIELKEKASKRSRQHFLYSETPYHDNNNNCMSLGQDSTLLYIQEVQFFICNRL